MLIVVFPSKETTLVQEIEPEETPVESPEDILVEKEEKALSFITQEHEDFFFFVFHIKDY